MILTVLKMYQYRTHIMIIEHIIMYQLGTSILIYYEYTN